MSRPYLKQAREENDLTQEELADMIGCERRIISHWENGTKDPTPPLRRLVREKLNRPKERYPHLFDNVTESSPTLLRVIMDTAKRQTIKVLGALGVSSILGDVTVEIVTGPKISAEEYIFQAETSFSNCWSLLSVGEYKKVDDALNSHIPTLTRFINIASPFQSTAAYLGVQACIMKICIAKQSLDYAACNRYCSTIEKYAVLADNPTILAITQSWQANTYNGFFHQPQRAVPILLKALSNTNDSELLRSSIYSDLSMSYAQWSTEKGFESEALKYSALAYNTFPTLPTLDPYYSQIAMSESELRHFDGWMHLHLSKSIPNSKHAQIAYDTFNEASSKKTMNLHYSCNLLIKNADVASSLGYKDECINYSTQAFTIATDVSSIKKLNDLNTVVRNVPKEWKKETAIQDLQQEINKTLKPLIVAPR